MELTMPSKTPAQKHLMDAVAHGWKMPGGKGPPVSVAKEFIAADKTHPAFADGGLVMSNKGYQGKSEDYAKGGGQLGRAKDFMKIPDQFTDGRLPPKDTGSADDPDQDYEKTGKTGKLSKPTGDKVLKTVKPK